MEILTIGIKFMPRGFNYLKYLLFAMYEITNIKNQEQQKLLLKL